MSTDVYCAAVNSLIAAGRFNHIGEASVRWEGQTAWGVWLRIDHGRASRGGSRLRCGVLFHPVNRELTFHGVATVVTQLLLPLFEDWTFPSVELLPSARPAHHEPLDDPSVPEDAFTRFLGLSSHPRPQATSASTRPAPSPPPPIPTPGEEHSLRSVISGLIVVCEANQVSIRHLTTDVNYSAMQRALRTLLPAHLSLHRRRPSPRVGDCHHVRCAAALVAIHIFMSLVPSDIV